jgi:hypothetical protein
MESPSVLRRWIALLAAVFVLFGTISPAVLCAAQPGKDDCCPTGRKMPCGGEQGEHGNRVLSVVACPVTASQVSPPSLSERRTQLEQPSHSPDPVIAVAWLATFVPPRSPISVPPTPLSTPAVRDDGKPIYLHTRRLRL